MKIFFELNNSLPPKQKIDSRINNSQIIYESYKIKQLESTKNTKFILFALSILFSINVIIIITLLQYYQYANRFYID